MESICIPLLVMFILAWVCTKIFPKKEEKVDNVRLVPFTPPPYDTLRTRRVPDPKQLSDINAEINRITAEIEAEIAQEKARLRNNPKVVATRPSYVRGKETIIRMPTSYVQPLGPGPEVYEIIEGGEWKIVRRGTVEYNELWSQLPGAKGGRR